MQWEAWKCCKCIDVYGKVCISLDSGDTWFLWPGWHDLLDIKMIIFSKTGHTYQTSYLLSLKPLSCFYSPPLSLWFTVLSITDSADNAALSDWRNQIVQLHTTCQNKSVATSRQRWQGLEMTSWCTEHDGQNCAAKAICICMSNCFTLLPEVLCKVSKVATITFNATTRSTWWQSQNTEGY